MRGVDNRESVCFRKSVQESEKLFDPLRIQTGGRFIENKDLGFHGKNSCNGHTLFFTAGKVVRGPVAQIFETEHMDDGINAVRNRFLVKPEIAGTKSDVLFNGC